MRWKKWLVLLAVIVVVYVLWRKFGQNVKDAVSTATA